MNNQDESSRSCFSVVQSGDGYELISPDGQVIAWMLDWKWALQILLALELQAQRL